MKISAQEEYGLEEKYYRGLRLAEQTFSVADTLAYVDKMKMRAWESESVRDGYPL